MPPSRGWRSAAMQCVWKPRRSAVGIDGIWIWNQTCFWCQDFCQDPILIRWCSPIAQASDCWCDIEGVIQSFSNIIGQTDESALNWPRLCKLWETLVRVCFSRMKIRWLMKLTPEKSCVGCEVGLEPLKLWAHGVWTFWIAYSVRPGGNASRMGKMSTKLEFISLWIVINCHINQYKVI